MSKTGMEINARGWAGTAGAGVSMPLSAWFAPPHVTWNHVDGPLLSWRGGIHWLTWHERLALKFRRTTLQEIATKRLGD